MLGAAPLAAMPLADDLPVTPPEVAADTAGNWIPVIVRRRRRTQ